MLDPKALSSANVKLAKKHDGPWEAKREFELREAFRIREFSLYAWVHTVHSSCLQLFSIVANHETKFITCVLSARIRYEFGCFLSTGQWLSRMIFVLSAFLILIRGTWDSGSCRMRLAMSSMTIRFQVFGMCRARMMGKVHITTRNKGRNSQFIPEAISQSEGMLRIKSDWNPSFAFAKGYGVPPITTGALISKELLKYGYMEIRCRVGKSPMSGAFWAVGNGAREWQSWRAGCI